MFRKVHLVEWIRQLRVRPYLNSREIRVTASRSRSTSPPCCSRRIRPGRARRRHARAARWRSSRRSRRARRRGPGRRGGGRPRPADARRRERDGRRPRRGRRGARTVDAGDLAEALPEPSNSASPRSWRARRPTRAGPGGPAPRRSRRGNRRPRRSPPSPRGSASRSPAARGPSRAPGGAWGRRATGAALPAVEDADVRAVELVGRAAEEVATHRPDVDQPVRGVMDRVHEDQGAGRMGDPGGRATSLIVPRALEAAPMASTGSGR